MSTLELVLIAGAAGALGGLLAAALVLRRGTGPKGDSGRELASLTKRVEDTHRLLKVNRAENRRGHSEAARKLDDVARLLAVDPEDLPYPQRLTAHRFGLLSQAGEDGVLWGLLKVAGGGGRRFAELGCGDNGGNSGFLATEAGFTGLMVDGSEDLTSALRLRIRGDRTQVVQRWIERDTVDALLAEFGFDGDLDMLGIDLDGNDFWIWEAIERCSPRVLVMEYNTAMGPDRSVTVPYTPDFARDPSTALGLYYGASLTALARLGARKGYRLVACEHVNAFFLRNDVAPQIPACSVREAYKVYAKEAERIGRLERGYYEELEALGLELVEVDEAGRSVSAPAAS